jgi:hypothetical protein
VQVGDIILVIDLGGGTADFSLIAVTERDGSLELVRVAVGDHILLGGDNMDLALAHAVRAKLAEQGNQLDPWQLQGLTHGCRNAKEILLSDARVESGAGGGAEPRFQADRRDLRTELTRDEVTRNLVEGFFPKVEAAARPAARARAALTKLGLPYAQDAAMTRHLAAFLARQVDATRDLEVFRLSCRHATFLHPTAVLFNGGVFKAEPLLERTLGVLNGWLAAEGAPPARLLEGIDLDLAVARGAAYYGYVRRGRGVRIRGGTAKPITSVWKAPCRRCRAWSRRSKRCASRRSVWRKGTQARVAAAGSGAGGRRAGALPFLRFLGAAHRSGRDSAGAMDAGRGRGVGRDRSDVARRGPATGRSRSGAITRSGH